MMCSIKGLIGDILLILMKKQMIKMALLAHLWLGTSVGVSGVKSVSDEIAFDVLSDGVNEAVLSSQQWSISMNAQVHGDLSVGTNVSPSILNVHGRIKRGMQTISSNTTLSGNGYILANTSAGNIAVDLPYAGNVSGEFYTIKKISPQYELLITGGGNEMDDYASITLNPSANLLDPITFFSNGEQWYLDQIPSEGIEFTQNLYLPSDDSPSLWLDASVLSSVSLNSGNVSQWSDLSTHGTHALQSSSNMQPIWSGNGLVFQGQQSLKINDVDQFNSWDHDRTMVVVMSYQGSASNTILHWGVSGSTFRDEQWIGEGNKLTLVENHDTGTPNEASTTCPDDVSQGLMAVYKYQNSDTRKRWVRFNGALAAESSSDRSSSIAPDGELYIGYDRDGIDYNQAGSFASGVTLHEIIVVPAALDEATLLKLEGYVMHKWNLNARLPAGHPYRYALPTK